MADQCPRLTASRVKIHQHHEIRHYEDIYYVILPRCESPPIVEVVHADQSSLENASVVQWAFYHNAGFTRLRNRPELKNVDPRYDPAVIKTNSRPARSLDAVLSDLAKEDFKSRVPPGKRFPSALDYHEAYKSGVLTPTDIAETLLPMVRRDISSATNHSVAFVETQVELVRAAAAKSTLRYKSGKPLSPLDGVPVVIKDQVDLEGYRTRSGSTLDFTPANVVSTYCVAVWEQAGAVVVGKTSMHEVMTILMSLTC